MFNVTKDNKIKIIPNIQWCIRNPFTIGLETGLKNRNILVTNIVIRNIKKNKFDVIIIVQIIYHILSSTQQ